MKRNEKNLIAFYLTKKRYFGLYRELGQIVAFSAMHALTLVTHCHSPI